MSNSFNLTTKIFYSTLVSKQWADPCIKKLPMWIRHHLTKYRRDCVCGLIKQTVEDISQHIGIKRREFTGQKIYSNSHIGI